MGTDLKQTPLHSLHLESGGRMVSFAGYHLPLRYEMGLAAEHAHTRTAASLFDVSHMGVIRVHGPHAAERLEMLLPQDLINLAPGRQRYGFLTNDGGGIIDDLIIGNDESHLTLVVNAATKTWDHAHLAEHLLGLGVELADEVAVLALQGPAAASVLDALAPGVAELSFMDRAGFAVEGVPVTISRSGYTGEDGFELLVPADSADAIARTLLAADDVAPAGLGARDSLRLEAGLTLYGRDIDETTSPIEAGLSWAIPQRRRREGGFFGDAVILQQLDEGPPRRLVGLLAEGKAPIREGAVLHAADAEAGIVTSGGVSPTLQRPIAMGYVAADLAESGTTLTARARGRDLPCTVTEMPFVPHRYRR